MPTIGDGSSTSFPSKMRFPLQERLDAIGDFANAAVNTVRNTAVLTALFTVAAKGADIAVIDSFDISNEQLLLGAAAVWAVLALNKARRVILGHDVSYITKGDDDQAYLYQNRHYDIPNNTGDHRAYKRGAGLGLAAVLTASAALGLNAGAIAEKVEQLVPVATDVSYAAPVIAPKALG